MPDKRDAITIASLVTNGLGLLGDEAFLADVKWLDNFVLHVVQTASIFTAKS